METQDPAVAELISFLDGARRVASVQKQKHIIFELLNLQPDENVLDAGCGTGDDIRDIAQLVGQNGWCVGIDQNGALIEVARKRSEGKNLPVEFHQSSIYELNFPDNTFHVTRAERVFEHLYEPERALAEMIRVTRPGGRVLVASPDMDTNIIDHPDRSVTRRICHFESDRRPNGLAGQKLYGMFHDVGLRDLRVRAIVHITTSYEGMLSFLDVRERAEAARNGGAITASECASWLAQLERAGRAGHFFMSTNHYIVCGRKV